MNTPQETWWARGIEGVIRSDFERLKKVLGISSTRLELRFIKTGGFYFSLPIDLIRLGVRTGYHRKLLIHECLHAIGLEHNSTDFSSSMTYDKVSPQIERLIFGGD